MSVRSLLTVFAMLTMVSQLALSQDAGLNVSLPLKELRALIEREKADEGAPVDVVFGPATYTLAAAEKNATLTIAAEITLPNARWVLIPLGTGTGVTAVTLDDKPAAVVRQNGKLLAVVDAKNTRSAKLLVTASSPIRVAGDVSSITLPLVPTPIATLNAKLAAANVNVKAPELLSAKVDTNAAGTTVSGTLPQAESITLQWSSRDARPARVTVQQFHHVVLDRGLIRNTTTLQYDILRAPVESLRIAIPDGIEITRVSGDQLSDYAIDEAAKPRTLTVQLKEPTQGASRLVVQYEQRLKDDQLNPALALLSPQDVASESGFVGIEVRGNYEVTPTVEKADRVDVAQLPEVLWSTARSPLRFGYRYDKPGATLSVALRPLQDLEVLIAMSDISEVSTTVTPEGKVITKMIMIVRNNQKSHLRVTLPEGSQLWSAFVDDRPVTPSKDEKGDVLLPLRKSESVDRDDDTNYMNKRQQRRQNEGLQAQQHAMQERIKQLESDDDDVSDLKPYDVELVYISPNVVLAERGQIKLALPKVDMPIGQLAWAVFLPSSSRVVDSTGNIREVNAFSLPFRHFGESAIAESKAMDKLASAQQALAQMDAAKAMEQVALSSKAKGVLPVRVEIPIAGSIYRFEKMLSVDEMPAIELTYVKRN